MEIRLLNLLFTRLVGEVGVWYFVKFPFAVFLNYICFSVGSLTALTYELVAGGLVSMEVLVGVLITSLVLTGIFFQRMRKFSYIYIEYVISDFIVES